MDPKQEGGAKSGAKVSSHEKKADSGNALDTPWRHARSAASAKLPAKNGGKPVLYAIHGDLITTQTDVIVVCSSSRFLLETVLKEGGDSMRASYKAQSKQTTDDSVVIVPTNGSFPSKEIYFLPFNHNADKSIFKKSLQTFVSLAAGRAAAAGHRSIAFPAVGCGEYGCSTADVANVMIREARRQIAQHVLSILFVIQIGRSDVYEEFQNQVGALALSASASNLKSVLVAIEGSVVDIAMGDITAQRVDAIVVSSNSIVLLEKVFDAAGKGTRQAYERAMRRNANSLLFSTPAGDLPCKEIFFVNWQPDENKELLRQSVVDFVWNVLMNVNAQGHRSMALPAIGCGRFACSVNVVVSTLVSEVKKQIKQRKLTVKVRFVIQPDHQNVYDEFHKQILMSDEAVVKSSHYELPSTWQMSADSKTCVVVPKSSSEYKSALVTFEQSMKGIDLTVIKLERIQNERWYKQYMVHSEDFRKRLDVDTEQRLFHGCSEESAVAIVDDNFNRSYAGKNGTVYGVGVYFSTDASYSHGYAHANSKGEQRMFLARVLVGKTTPGDGSMKTRPVGFDSTTDGNHIFVTYHDAQAYAEYLVTYKLVTKSSTPAV